MNARVPAATRGQAVGVGTLAAGRVYRAPSGRLCCLVPPPKAGPASNGDFFKFAYLATGYVPPPAALLGLDAFHLSHRNLHLLREVGP